MIYAPIYKDTYYTTTADVFEYTLMSGDEILFSGKSYKAPDKSNIVINISKYCRDYINQLMVDFRELEDDVVPNFGSTLAVNLMSGELIVEQYTFLYDWSYDSS